MLWLDPHTPLPHPSTASPEGIVAVGGEITVSRLIEAYKKGIFPWYEEGGPVLWWSPDPRTVLFPEKLHIPKSLRKHIREHPQWHVTRNRNFDRVIRHCAAINRPGQAGTWITPEMIDAYTELHRRGLAHSYEVWDANERLIGGLYGVDVKNGIFSGESMFSLETNASKYALIRLCKDAPEYHYKLIDAQVHTPYLAMMGAEEIPRSRFLKYLENT